MVEEDKAVGEVDDIRVPLRERWGSRSYSDFGYSVGKPFPN